MMRLPLVALLTASMLPTASAATGPEAVVHDDGGDIYDATGPDTLSFRGTTPPRIRPTGTKTKARWKRAKRQSGNHRNRVQGARR